MGAVSNYVPKPHIFSKQTEFPKPIHFLLVRFLHLFSETPQRRLRHVEVHNSRKCLKIREILFHKQNWWLWAIIISNRFTIRKVSPLGFSDVKRRSQKSVFGHAAHRSYGPNFYFTTKYRGQSLNGLFQNV